MNGLAGLGASGCETGDLEYREVRGGSRPVFKGWLAVACLHSCLLIPLSSHLPERIETTQALVDKPVESSVQVQADPEECSDLKMLGRARRQGGILKQSETPGLLEALY